MKKWIVSLGILGIILYYFISTQKLPKESYFLANKQETITQANESKSFAMTGNISRSYFPLRLSTYLVYLGEDLALKNTISLVQRVSYSDHYYALYQEDQTQFSIFDATGKPLATINDNGVPLIIGKRIFSLDHFAGSVKNFDENGTLRWTYNVGAYITSIQANEHLTIIGGLNGYVTILADDGTLFYEYRPGGSASEIIYGSAISADGQYFAIISGLNPQRFLLFRRGSRSYLPIYHTDLKEQMTRPVSIKFSQNSDVVLYEEPGFLNGYRIGSHAPFSLAIDGDLKEFSTNIFGHYFGFLVKNNQGHKLTILNDRNLFPLLRMNLYLDESIVMFLPKTVILGTQDWLGFLDYESVK
ncbi:MAG: hypothetical protein ACRCVN_06075 [Spirochaetia bacterium]